MKRIYYHSVADGDATSGYRKTGIPPMQSKFNTLSVSYSHGLHYL